MGEGILVTNIQRYCIHDGEGVRTTVFLKGCPLRCPWCANPETQSYKNEIMHMKTKCKACMTCVHECKAGALKAGADGFPYKDTKKCVQCGKCVEACLYGAMKYAAKEYTIPELFKECVSDKAFYGENGGVTFSGGECLSFEKECLSLINLLREENINITFETCGYGRSETLLKYSEHAQRIYFDIKHYDKNKFQEIANGDLDIILNNLHILTDSYAHTAVRIPVVYGINDSYGDMENLAGIIKENIGSKGIEFIELLPFHNMGETKYEGLYREYNFSGKPNMNKEHVTEYIDIFEKQGFKCIVN